MGIFRKSAFGDKPPLVGAVNKLVGVKVSFSTFQFLAVGEKNHGIFILPMVVGLDTVVRQQKQILPFFIGGNNGGL